MLKPINLPDSIDSTKNEFFMRAPVLLPFFLLLMLISMTASAQLMTGELTQARKLEKQGKEKEALNKFQEVLEISPNNYEALWQTSFLYSRIGNRKEDHDTKVEYFNKAKEYAKRALEVDSSDPESNYVMSVAMGRMALIVGARERVKASKDIRKYAKRALEYNPEHAGAWHVLGLWHYKVANLNFAERAAANMLFGGAPEGASEEKSIESFQKAIQYDPDFMLYYYDLADTYSKMGKNDSAKKYYRKVVDMKSVTPDDPGMKKDAREFLAEH